MRDECGEGAFGFGAGVEGAAVGVYDDGDGIFCFGAGVLGCGGDGAEEVECEDHVGRFVGGDGGELGG